MTPRAKITITFVLLALLGSLGAADYYLSDEQYAASVTPTDSETEGEPQNIPESDGTTSAPTGAVAKARGPQVEEVAVEQGLEVRPGEDLNLLKQVAANGPDVQSLTLLKDQDRIGSVAWIESPEVKNIFTALKEALITAFSPALRDLKDETVQAAGKPTRNMLLFLDPSISEERMLFIRVRERLYEFHAAPGKESLMNEFAQSLTGR